MRETPEKLHSIIFMIDIILLKKNLIGFGDDSQYITLLTTLKFSC